MADIENIQSAIWCNRMGKSLRHGGEKTINILNGLKVSMSFTNFGFWDYIIDFFF